MKEELPPFSDTHHADEHTSIAEQAYRRGYYQGYFTALEDLTRKTKAQCEKHLYGKLYKWRYHKTKSKWIEPPELH